MVAKAGLTVMLTKITLEFVYMQILNIDFSYIEAKANEVVKNDRNVFLVLGQLIDK